MKQVKQDGTMYQVWDGDHVIYQTTEGRLLIHWLTRHPDTYNLADTINLGPKYKGVQPEAGT